MDFLQLTGKNILVTGVANKKSIATFIAHTLLKAGAQVILSVQSQEHRQQAQKIFGEQLPIYLCDVQKESEIQQLASTIQERHLPLEGLVHSLAYGRFEPQRPFHATSAADFLQATQISCFSLTQMSHALKDCFAAKASVVALSISNTKATSYGYLGPIKAALDASVSFLAKSFSAFSHVRFNTVCAGPLKTSASAGIPHYLENYLYSQQLTLRKEPLQTNEVADCVCFLLSPRSSGINAAQLVVDAGMSSNYFDESIVQSWSKNSL